MEPHTPGVIGVVRIFRATLVWEEDDGPVTYHQGLDVQWHTLTLDVQANGDVPRYLHLAQGKALRKNGALGRDVEDRYLAFAKLPHGVRQRFLDELGRREW